MRQFDLRDAALDAIGHQFLMPFGARFAEEHLRNHIAIFVIAVGIYGRHGANAASGSPSTRTCMICCSDTLAAFDQRPHFTAAIDYGFQTLEHKHHPYVLQ